MTTALVILAGVLLAALGLLSCVGYGLARVHVDGEGGFPVLVAFTVAGLAFVALALLATGLALLAVALR